MKCINHTTYKHIPIFWSMSLRKNLWSFLNLNENLYIQLYTIKNIISNRLISYFQHLTIWLIFTMILNIEVFWRFFEILFEEHVCTYIETNISTFISYKNPDFDDTTILDIIFIRLRPSKNLLMNYLTQTITYKT